MVFSRLRIIEGFNNVPVNPLVSFNYVVINNYIVLYDRHSVYCLLIKMHIYRDLI